MGKRRKEKVVTMRNSIYADAMTAMFAIVIFCTICGWNISYKLDADNRTKARVLLVAFLAIAISGILLYHNHVYVPKVYDHVAFVRQLCKDHEYDAALVYLDENVPKNFKNVQEDLRKEILTGQLQDLYKQACNDNQYLHAAIYLAMIPQDCRKGEWDVAYNAVFTKLTDEEKQMLNNIFKYSN